MKRMDWAILGTALLLCFGLWALLPKTGNTLVIRSAGKTVMSIRLPTDPAQWEIRPGVIAETDGKRVRMQSSTCPDQLCVKQGWVASGAVICLPERVTLEITDGTDAYAY
ncbi:MAG: NusG domain II-containing protein [Oscillospiraceae bacterium]|jgi:hypothetical protein|nr:NusG domain II-containing protein [Oscillospiraceae bacterium]